MLATLQALKDHIIHSDIVKSITALRATVFTLELGWQRVKLEYDALRLVRALQKERQKLVSLWPIN